MTYQNHWPPAMYDSTPLRDQPLLGSDHVIVAALSPQDAQQSGADPARFRPILHVDRQD